MSNDSAKSTETDAKEYRYRWYDYDTGDAGEWTTTPDEARSGKRERVTAVIERHELPAIAIQRYPTEDIDYRVRA